MKIVSNKMLDYVKKMNSDQIILFLITIEFQSGQIYRYTTSHQNIFSQGNEFEASDIDIGLPQSALQRGRTDGRLTLSNVHRNLIRPIRTSNQKPKVILEIVLASTPNIIEIGPIQFNMGQINYDDEQIDIPIEIDDIFRKPFQTVQFDPHQTPALYA